MLKIGGYDEHRNVWVLERSYSGGWIELVSGARSLRDVEFHASGLGVPRADVIFSPGSFDALRGRTDGPSSGWSQLRTPR
jgi:hypothetical protein